MTETKSSDRISISEMVQAIKNSGYLIEQRVESIIEEFGYYVETNPAYPDPDTGKSREFDLSPIAGKQVFKKESGFIFINLLLECENNKQPIVFFESHSPVSFLNYQDLKIVGIPVKIHKDGEYESLQDFFSFDKFHHYCKGTFSTQYCSFHKRDNKSPWLALHEESQHGSFTSLINALEFSVKEMYENWVLPEKDEKEPLNLTLFYPVMVFQGELYVASQESRKVRLVPKDHVQFRKEFHSSKYNDTYQIDVVRERYLKKYLSMVEKEADAFATRLKRKKKVITLSVDKIIDEARTEVRAGKSIRECFEF